MENTKNGDITIRNEESGQTLRRSIVHLKRVEWQCKAVGEDQESKVVAPGVNGRL